METFGETLRRLREEKGEPLRMVASYLSIDQAILSKAERNQRRLTREQVVKLAKYFKVNKDELLLAWLSDKLVYEVEDEDLALKALQVAEAKVEYEVFLKVDRNRLLAQIKQEIKKHDKIQRAWIYGSFSRKDDGPQSDIDIAITTDDDFSYFDLADIQYKLENAVNRRIDIGFLDSFKPYVWEHVKPDLKLIYEKG